MIEAIQGEIARIAASWYNRLVIVRPKTATGTSGIPEYDFRGEPKNPLAVRQQRLVGEVISLLKSRLQKREGV